MISDDPGHELASEAAAVVARLRGLVPTPQRRVDGIPGGLHRGARRGGGVEFAEHRDYAPGDDLRYLDWRAYARNDRYSIKRFEQEVHASVTLVLDASASMAIEGAPPPDKLATVLLVCAALATLIVRRGDAVGLMVAGRSLDVAPAGGEPHLRRLIAHLATLTVRGPSGLESLGHRLVHGGPRRGVLVVVSDLLADPAAALAPLASARRLGPHVVLMHAVHPVELDLGFGGPVHVVCPETDARALVDPRSLRGEWDKLVERHHRELRDNATAAGLVYRLANLGDDPAELVRGIVMAMSAGVRGTPQQVARGRPRVRRPA